MNAKQLSLWQKAYYFNQLSLDEARCLLRITTYLEEVRKMKEWVAVYYHTSRDGWVSCGPYVIDWGTREEAEDAAEKWRQENAPLNDEYGNRYAEITAAEEYYRVR